MSDVLNTQRVITDCLIVPMICTIVDVYTFPKIVTSLENSDRLDLVR